MIVHVEILTTGLGSVTASFNTRDDCPMTQQQFNQMKPQAQEYMIRHGIVPSWWKVSQDRDNRPKIVRSVFNPSTKVQHA